MTDEKARFQLLDGGLKGDWQQIVFNRAGRQAAADIPAEFVPWPSAWGWVIDCRGGWS